MTSAHPVATEGNVLWRNPPIDRLAWRAKEFRRFTAPLVVARGGCFVYLVTASKFDWDSAVQGCLDGM